MVHPFLFLLVDVVEIGYILGKKTVASLCSSNNTVSGEKSSKFPEDKKTSARGDQSFQKK